LLSAFYLFRLHTWYIIPLSAIGRRLSVTLCARRHKGIYSPYFEAWRLLKLPRPCTCTIHACADPDYDTSEGFAGSPCRASSFATGRGMSEKT
jgi:hypothetical protein